MKKFNYKINGKEYTVAVNKIEDTIAEVEVNGTAYQVELEKKEEEPVVSKIQRPVASASSSSKPAASGAGSIKSPLPGIIIDVLVNVGDHVKKGQTIAMLEAMKMENAIQAAHDGTVTEINVGKGDSVLEGVTIMVIG